MKEVRGCCASLAGLFWFVLRRLYLVDVIGLDVSELDVDARGCGYGVERLMGGVGLRCLQEEESQVWI